MKYELMNLNSNQPKMFENSIRDVNTRKAYYGEQHFNSLSDLSNGNEQIHIVYDDTEVNNSVNDLEEEIWVSCCGLVKAAEWPVIDEEPSYPIIESLTRGWKSIDCMQSIYMEPRKLTDLAQSSDSSSVDSLEFDQVIYDVPSKIPSPQMESVSKSDLFRHKSNPNLLQHQDTDVIYVPMGSDFNNFHYSRASPIDKNSFKNYAAGGSKSPMFLSASSENLSQGRGRFRIDLDKKRINRFNSTDIISSVSSLSEVEEISTSEENIYMELPETENSAKKKEARTKNHAKARRNLFRSKTVKQILSPTDTTKRFPYHKDPARIKKKLTTFLKPKTPLYAKIQNCPPVERALVNRVNVPLPAVPVIKVRLSQVEDPYSLIEDKKSDELSSPISEKPVLVPVEISGENSTNHVVMCEEGIYENPKCCTTAPQPNLATHPARKRVFRKSLTLDLDRANQGLDYFKNFASQEDISMLSPVLCCVKSPSEKSILKIDHMYQEKCDNFDYDVPRAICTLSSPKEEFHAATLGRFKPKEVDARPNKEKLHELDQLLNAIHSYMAAHKIDKEHKIFDSEWPSLVSKSSPGYLDPVVFYKRNSIPLTLTGTYTQNGDAKPLYRTVLKKKDRLPNGQNKVSSLNKTEKNYFLSTDTEDDYTTIDENHLGNMAKRKFFFLLSF